MSPSWKTMINVGYLQCKTQLHKKTLAESENKYFELLIKNSILFSIVYSEHNWQLFNGGFAFLKCIFHWPLHRTGHDVKMNFAFSRKVHPTFEKVALHLKHCLYYKLSWKNHLLERRYLGSASLKTVSTKSENVYMRPEVNSNRFEKLFRLHGNFTTVNLEISNLFQKYFHLHGDLNVATFQTVLRF